MVWSLVIEGECVQCTLFLEKYTHKTTTYSNGIILLKKKEDAKTRNSMKASFISHFTFLFPLLSVSFEQAIITYFQMHSRFCVLPGFCFVSGLSFLYLC